jgi:hypothetical protein
MGYALTTVKSSRCGGSLAKPLHRDDIYYEGENSANERPEQQNAISEQHPEQKQKYQFRNNANSN